MIVRNQKGETNEQAAELGVLFRTSSQGILQGLTLVALTGGGTFPEAMFDLTEEEATRLQQALWRFAAPKSGDPDTNP